MRVEDLEKEKKLKDELICAEIMLIVAFVVMICLTVYFSSFYGGMGVYDDIDSVLARASIVFLQTVAGMFSFYFATKGIQWLKKRKIAQFVKCFILSVFICVSSGLIWGPIIVDENCAAQGDFGWLLYIVSCVVFGNVLNVCIEKIKNYYKNDEQVMNDGEIEV